MVTDELYFYQDKINRSNHSTKGIQRKKKANTVASPYEDTQREMRFLNIVFARMKFHDPWLRHFRAQQMPLKMAWSNVAWIYTNKNHARKTHSLYVHLLMREATVSTTIFLTSMDQAMSGKMMVKSEGLLAPSEWTLMRFCSCKQWEKSTIFSRFESLNLIRFEFLIQIQFVSFFNNVFQGFFSTVRILIISGMHIRACMSGFVSPQVLCSSGFEVAAGTVTREREIAYKLKSKFYSSWI